jgi:hypothetical protein
VPQEVFEFDDLVVELSQRVASHLQAIFVAIAGSWNA